MAIHWPNTLPQYVQQQTFQGTSNNGALRQEMGAGPAYQMPRTDVSVERFDITLLPMELTEYQTFRNFWFDTLGNGSLPFQWIHPELQTSAQVQFDASQGFRRTAFGTKFIISAVLEVTV